MSEEEKMREEEKEAKRRGERSEKKRRFRIRRARSPIWEGIQREEISESRTEKGRCRRKGGSGERREQ